MLWGGMEVEVQRGRGVVYGSGSQTGGRVPLVVHGSTAGVLENKKNFTLSEFQL